MDEQVNALMIQTSLLAGLTVRQACACNALSDVLGLSVYNSEKDLRRKGESIFKIFLKGSRGV